MRARTLLSLLSSMTLLLVLAACSGGGGDASNAPAESAGTAVSQAGKIVEHAQEVADAVPAVVTVTGTLGCGHCNFHIGESCSAAIQTADERVYILDGLAAGDDLYDHRFDGGRYQVTGRAHDVDGVHHLSADNIEKL